MRAWSAWWIACWVVGSAAVASEPTLRGTVRDEAGRPLPGARIELRPVLGLHAEGLRRLAGETQARPVAQSRSDRQGLFELTAPEIGLWRVTVAADGRVPMTRLLRPLLSDEALTEVRLLSAEAVTVNVISDGSPIAGARIDVRTPQDFEPWRQAWNQGRWWPERRWALTDDAGRGSLWVASHEQPRIEAMKAGFQPAVAISATALARASRAGNTADGTANAPATIDSERVAQLTASPERLLRLVDADGQPAAGVLLLDDRRPLALSADDGSVRVTTAYLERQPPRLIVSTSDGYQVTLAAIPADQTVVRLLPGQEIRGRVTNPEGQPIVGAIVWRDRGPASAVHTDARGQFRWLTAEQRLFLGIAADGYQARHHTVTAAPIDLAITLDPATTLAGQVVDADGLPLAGARVQVRQASSRPPSWNQRHRQARSVLTAEDGGFRLNGLPAGDLLEILAQHQGYAPSATTAVANSESQDLRIVLQRGHVVIGQVVDVDEQPIPSAVVRFFHHPAPGEARLEIATGELLSAPEAITDAEGRFTVANLPTGEHSAEIRHASYAPRTLRGVQAAKPESSGLPADPVDLGALVLEAAVAIEAKVTDPDGEPIAGARVRLHSRTDPWGAPRVHRPTEDLSQKTDDRGFFRQDQLQTGSLFDLHLTHPAYVDTQIQAVEAPTEETLEIVLRPGAKISGLVVGSDGRGVARVLVQASSEIRTENAFGSSSMTTHKSQRTDVDGRFELRGVHPGEVRLSAQLTGYAEEAQQLRLVEGEHRDGVRLELRRGATIAGRVLDAQGRPVLGSDVSVTHQTGPHAERGMTATTDGDGRFRLNDRPLGTVEVTARHPEHGAAKQPLELIPGENTVELTLAPSRLVSGRVLDPSRQPLPGAKVQLSWYSGSTGGSMSTHTSADGTFSLLPEKQGDYELSADHDGLQRVSRSVTVGEQPLTGLELVLQEGAVITGAVLGIAPEERDHVMIVVSPFVEPGSADSYPQQAYPVTVDSQGHYRATGLSPGPWQLQGSLAQSARRAQAKVTVPAGEAEVVQDLEFSGGDLRLIGVVIAGGEPAAGANVSVVSANGSHAWSMASNDGRFRLEGLEPGTYTFQITSDWGQYQEEVELWSDRELHIDLQLRRINGWVVASNGEPLIDIKLTLFDPSLGVGHRPIATRSSDGEGRFDFPRLRDGQYRLLAAHPGFTTQTVPVDVRSADLLGLEIVLGQGAPLVLQVRTTSGEPPGLIQVAARDASGQPVAFEDKTPDPDGRLEASAIPTGTWQLTLIGQSSAPAQLTVEVPGGPYPVMLEPRTQLRVVVPALAGAPEAATLLVLDAAGQAFTPSKLGSPLEHWPLMRGETLLGFLPPGTWQLRAEAASGATWSGVATTQPGQPVTVTLE